VFCQHCGKPIKRGLDDKGKKKARKLLRDGYSVRDAAKILFNSGYNVSPSTVQRAKIRNN
jgi:hypothetical protein